MTEAPADVMVPRKLRILLIAYEFPPSPSAQSLRWAYLTNRLAGFGHEVHVMAPAIGGSSVGLPEVGPGVHVHRVWPGPVRALLCWLERRRPPIPASRSLDEPSDAIGPNGTGGPFRLNWKGRLLQRCLAVVAWGVFPDVRGEWRFPARRALPRLLRSVRPDVVISSHEPATTLQLGLRAKRLGFRWIADIADPVLAPYTPRRWHRHAFSLESKVMHEADHVLVSARAALQLLRERHDTAVPATVVTQGFDECLSGSEYPERHDRPLELLYAGSFYSFRDPRALVDAILQVPGVHLSVASGNVPEWLSDCAERSPDKLTLLGAVPHRRLLLMQRKADVLVNLANADASQVPGKFYEYLGAGRPILHLSAFDGDATGEVLLELRRGWVCPAQQGDIVTLVSTLVKAHRSSRMTEELNLGRAQVQAWSWTASARCVERALVRMSLDLNDCMSR